VPRVRRELDVLRLALLSHGNSDSARKIASLAPSRAGVKEGDRSYSSGEKGTTMV
jgi:hypothetical protein